MAASSFIYNTAKAMGMVQAAVTGTTVNLCFWSSTTASYYFTLLSNNYVPAETHIYASAFSGAELSSTSFTGGCGGTMRLSITGRVLNINQTSNQVEFQCNGVTWSGISAGTAHAFVIFQYSTSGATQGSDGNSPLICYNSLGGFPITTNATNLTFSVTSAGVFAGIDF